MDEILVQLRFTKDEYEKLKGLSHEKYLTVPQYIKSESLGLQSINASEFANSCETLMRLVGDLNIPKGGDSIEFTIRELFGLEWRTLSASLRIALGKSFYKRVVEDGVPKVQCVKKNKANTMVYRKQY